MYQEYLLSFHKNELLEILKDDDFSKYFSININFIELFENDPNIGNAVLKEPESTLEEVNNAVIKVETLLSQDTQYNCNVKNHVSCRIFGLPICPELHPTLFPGNNDINRFLQVSGTVVRMTGTKMLEYQRQYICAVCKNIITVKAEYDRKNIISPPRKCTNPDTCKSTNFVTMGELDSDNCKDYQEIKIQEQVSKLGIGSMPHSMWVTLEDDLVGICKPGDSVTICGIVKRRWDNLIVGKKMHIEIALKANHVQVNNTYASAAILTPETKTTFELFWEKHREEPLAGRDLILKSFCPQIFGLHLVKLAIAVVLAGGSHIEDASATGVAVRSESHLLLVGDPGTGKSQLLRFASKIIPRAVLTTGVGSTAAGLTVTAVMENGEWQLEGGALVMADGGICCIDEFNSMKEHDRISIHEAMEQQTISVAKASIVCKLNTRCSILAACNPKGNLDRSQPLCLNLSIASPLLSRFDLVLLLRDNVSQEWDSLVVDYVLNGPTENKDAESNLWNIDLLQAYFATIRRINPILTDDAQIILSNYYQMQRRLSNRNKARTTVRLMDSLIRLSQGHARLMYHEKVTITDAVYAVILVDTTTESDATLFDLSLNAHSTFPDNPMADFGKILGTVLGKLQLDELLEKELSNFAISSPPVEEIGGQNQLGYVVEPINNCENHTDVDPEIQVGLNRSPKRKRIKTPLGDFKLSKKAKIGEKTPIENELQMLHLLPSANDDIFNLNLNGDEIDFDNLENNFVITSTQKTQQSLVTIETITGSSVTTNKTQSTVVLKSSDCSLPRDKTESAVLFQPNDGAYESDQSQCNKTQSSAESGETNESTAESGNETKLISTDPGESSSVSINKIQTNVISFKINDCKADTINGVTSSQKFRSKIQSFKDKFKFKPKEISTSLTKSIFENEDDFTDFLNI